MWSDMNSKFLEEAELAVKRRKEIQLQRERGGSSLYLGS